MSLLDGGKAYLRVDGHQEDEVIRTRIDTATTCVLQGTGVEVKETDAQSILCMHMIVGYWYENRNAVGQGQNYRSQLPPSCCN
ncbi:MAG: head-tail connector protein [Dialister invisus]